MIRCKGNYKINIYKNNNVNNKILIIRVTPVFIISLRLSIGQYNITNSRKAESLILILSMDNIRIYLNNLMFVYSNTP